MTRFMKKKMPDNHFFTSMVVMVGCVCMTVCLGGYVPEYVWLEEETIPPRRGERVISLEEIENEDTGTFEGDDEQPVSGGDVWELPEDGNFLCKEIVGFEYARLDANEQLWYQDMAQAMGELSGKVKLSEKGIQAGLDEKKVDKIFQAVLNDHPELFYVEGYNYTQYTRAEKTVAIEFSGTYNMDKDVVLARRKEIEAEVSKILDKAPKGASDYDKIKYVYELLITETEYDLEAENNQNIYSVFVGHASVCQGYAKSFQYLMNRMGVECALVQGKVRETGEGHAWNLVKADGAYYYVDATWGDISYQSDDGESGEQQNMLPEISYDYLCVTTKQLLRTHVLDTSTGMPECSAEKDNYFVREGALFKEYDKEQLAELVDKRLEQGRYDISLRCADEQCYDTMCEALLERREIFNYLKGTGVSSFVYSNSDQQLTLTFFMVTSKQ